LKIRDGSAYECGVPGCGRWIKWALAYCILCGARLCRNPARADKVFAARALRPRGARGW
jgi:hypothetical protein